MEVEIISDIPLSHNRLRVNQSLQVQGLMYLLRGYITAGGLSPSHGLYLFHDGRLLNMTTRLTEIKPGSKKLCFNLVKESTFG